MLVGHTHDDIDQMFSRFSSYLHRHDAPTIEALHAACVAAYSPSPAVQFVDEVVDWCGWFDKHRLQLHGQSVPHQFRFRLEEGEVVLHAKEFCDGVYMQEPVRLLTSLPPDGSEPGVVEHKELELVELQKTVRVLGRFMDGSEVEQWKGFFAKESRRSRPAHSSTWREFKQKILREEPASSSSSSSSATSPSTSSSSSSSGPASVIASASSPSSLASAGGEAAPVVVEAVRRPLMYTGAHRRRRDDTPLEVGDWLALKSDGSDGLPFWVVKADEVLPAGVKITWHGCTKADGSGKWTPQQRAGTRQWYTDTIAPESILLFGFRMTTMGRLHKRTHKKLVQLAAEPVVVQPWQVGPSVSL